MNIMNKELISFIIPIYNSEKYIGKCLSSIVNQTYKNIEIIIVDDGSTDASYSLCKEYEKNDKRIKLIKQSNKGQSSARNKGISYASGEWITFVDSDDWIKHDLCEKVLQYLSKENDIIFFGYYDFVNGQESRNYRFLDSGNVVKIDNKSIKNIQLSTINPNMYREIFSGVPWGKLYRRNIIIDKEINFEEKIKIYEDSLFVFEYLNYVSSGIVIDYSMYYYRTTENSVCKRYRDNIFKLTLDNIKYLHDKLQGNIDESVWESYYIYVVNCFLNCITLGYCNLKNNDSYRVKKNQFVVDRNNLLIEEAFNKCKFKLLDKKMRCQAILVKKKNFRIIYIYKLIVNLIKSKKYRKGEICE